MKSRRPYRIGFQHPWIGRAEQQCYESMSFVASQLGHKLIHVITSEQILASDLDFVLCVASVQGKTTSIPTFGAVHEPRVRWWENERYFWNLATYDGYFTISDTLREFLHAFTAAFRKRQDVGYYFNTPQTLAVRSDVAKLATSGDLRLGYFGTNWDPRSRPVFRSLAGKSYMRIHGPAQAWEYLDERAYFGPVPFDGFAVQLTYARYGAGLVSLSRNHALDDIISNRIFEITSVGAVAICPDIPWIRRNFADSVYYFNPHDSYPAIVDQIDTIIDDIRSSPKIAGERAATAALIFEKRFAAEVLFSNVIDYFENWSDDHESTLGRRSDNSVIDVIVRVGGRSVSEIVLRAIRSIDAQECGTFRVIFVFWKEIDLAAITERRWLRIKEFLLVGCIGGDRAATLTAGLKQVENEFFCVLDDDDFWLPDHIPSLLECLAEMAPEKGFAYSGVITVRSLTEVEDPRTTDTREITRLSPAAAGRVSGRPTEGTVWDVTGAFAPNGWLAASPLLRGLCLDNWNLKTAEDTVLVAHLIANGEVTFSWRATAVQVLGSEGASNFGTTGSRQEDLFECMLRIGPNLELIERKFAVNRASLWERLGSQLDTVFREKGERTRPPGSVLVLQEGVTGISIHERDCERRQISLIDNRLQFRGKTTQIMDGDVPIVVIQPPAAPWNYGLIVPLLPDDLFSGMQFIVCEFAKTPGKYGVGILDSTETEFMTRVETPNITTPVELWIPLEEPQDARALIVQNWDEANEEAAILTQIWVVRDSG